MKVITVLGNEFNGLCQQMANEVMEHGFYPNIVIGVLTGGGIIGRQMLGEFRKKIHDVSYTEVKLQRPSTKEKEIRKTSRFLPRLPVWILNILRNLEVYYYEIKILFKKPKRIGSIEVDDVIKQKLQSGGCRVLIIDDCIDTGYTLKIIKEYFQQKFAGNDFRIAVATISHHFPVILPEYKLYNRVLIRFPWANDVKQ